MKNGTLILYIFVLAILALMYSNCGTQGTSESEIYQDSEVAAPTGVVAFDQLYSVVIKPKCQGCHGNFTSASGIRGYFTPGDPNGSRLYQVVRDDEMPKGGPPLSANRKAYVLNYVQNFQ